MVTVLPAFTRSTLLPDTLPALAVVVRLKPAWLMALAISPAVASLPASAAAGATMLPLAADVSAVVLAFRLPSAALVIVVPSVFTARSYTVAPAPLVLEAMLTLPSLDVTTVLAAAMLVLMLFNAVCSCPPLIASLLFAAIVPSATLVIFLLPASIPALVTLGPPVMVKPLVFSLLSPAVTLLTVKSFFKPTVTVPSALTWVWILSLS